MNIKFLTNQVFLEKLNLKPNEKRYQKINKERWESFRKNFGEKELGFVLAGDLLNQIEGEKVAPTYSFKESLFPYFAEKGTNCELFVISSYATDSKNFVSRNNLEKIVSFLDEEQKKGNIKYLVNSPRGTLSEDKLSILELPQIGIKIPETFNFNSQKEFKEAVIETGKEYVLKHRLGQAGRGIYKINPKNIQEMPEIDMKEYIAQERLNILNEKRIILLDGEYLGSRIIHDRTMPWDEESIKRKHQTERYTPSNEELEDTKKVMNHFDSQWGCIDWIETKEKGRVYLEYNGVGTGLGLGSPFPYNLNKEVAEKLKEKYF